MMTNCFLRKLITWSDPNLSASFLTAGNAVVLLLLFSTDPLSWLQFALVWGLLPLGLLVRLGGLDKRVRPLLSVSRVQSVVHHVDCSSASLIKGAVYLIVLSRLVDIFGLGLTLGLVGNAVMLVPLAWEQYGKTFVLPVQPVKDTVISTVQEGLNVVSSLGIFAPSIFGGVSVFVFILTLSHLFLLSPMLTLLGYTMLLCGAFVEFPEKLICMDFLANLKIERYVDILLWENYPKSISVFILLYVSYFVSAFTGVGLLAASVAGSAVAVHLVPDAIKEKATQEVYKQVAALRTKFTKPTEEPPKIAICRLVETQQKVVPVEAESEQKKPVVADIVEETINTEEVSQDPQVPLLSADEESSS